MSLSDLQRETGLPASVIYYYFGSKAGLLSAVMEWGTAQFFADLAAGPENANAAEAASPKQVLVGYFSRVHDVLGRNEEFFRLLLILLLTDDTPDVVEAVRRVRCRGRAEIHTRIAAAFSLYGAAAATSVADALTDFGFAAVEGAFLSRVAAGAKLHHRLFDQCIDAISALGEAHVSNLRTSD